MRRASSSPFLTTPYNEQMTSSIETLPSLFDMTQPWWDKVSYLLAPDGVVDQEVVDLWLERALLGSLSWKWEEDIIPLLQAVLLRTEGEKAEETFHVYWEHLRERSQVVNTECVFDSFSFLQALATTKPDTLRKWAGSLNLVDTVSSVHLLADMETVLPGIEQYAAWPSMRVVSNSLRTLPNDVSALEQEKPLALRVLRLAGAMHAAGFAAGAPMFRGMFSTLWESYSSVQLLEWVANDPVKTGQRIGAKALCRDLLPFFQSAGRPWAALLGIQSMLSTGPLSDTALFAQDLLLEMLRADAKMRGEEVGLVADIYTQVSDTKLRKEAVRFVLKSKDYEHIFALVHSRQSCELLRDCVQQWRTQAGPTWLNTATFLGTGSVGEEPDTEPSFGAMDYPPSTHGVLFSLLSNQESLLVMERAIRGLAGATTYADQNLVVDLEPSLWREDQRRVVGEFVPLRASILAHAYRRAYNGAGHEMEYEGIPETAIQPLKLCKTLYPEHRTQWSALEKEVLRRNMQDTTEYEQVYGAIFQTLTQLWGPGLDMEHARNILECTEMDPGAYFLTVLNQRAPNALPLPSLDEAAGTTMPAPM